MYALVYDSIHLHTRCQKGAKVSGFEDMCGLHYPNERLTVMGLIKTGLLLITIASISKFFSISYWNPPQPEVSHDIMSATCSVSDIVGQYPVPVVATLALLIVLVVIAALYFRSCCQDGCKSRAPVDISTALLLISEVDTVCTNALNQANALDAEGIRHLSTLAKSCKSTLSNKVKSA